MTEGLPEGDKGRIGLDVYQKNGNVIYALVEADTRSAGQGFGRSSGPSESGLFRSTDRGTTWEKMSDTNPRPMYYSQIRIDPSNPDRIYVLGTSLMSRTTQDERLGVTVQQRSTSTTTIYGLTQRIQTT